MLIETNQYVATTLATYIFSSIMVARASDDPVERGDDGIVCGTVSNKKIRY